ncbi:MAG: aldo/keto reductase [Anaerolineales bacterium]
MLTIDSTIPLRHGTTQPVQIPVFGLGTYRSPRGERTRQAVLEALQLGYRHFDTAKAYGNEKDVGAAIRESGIPREDVFVTTKLWNEDHGFAQALGALDRSLDRLVFDYVDLYLIHWPVRGLRTESWRALEALLTEGKTRAIGVSNYMVRHLRQLFDQEAGDGVSPLTGHGIFRMYLHARLDGRTTDISYFRFQNDQIADTDGFEEMHLIDGNGDDSALRMTHGGQRACFVDQLHDPTAVYIPSRVGLSWLHELTEHNPGGVHGFGFDFIVRHSVNPCPPDVLRHPSYADVPGFRREHR